MKKTSLVVLCFLITQFIVAQHKGNYDVNTQISRQNIVATKMGNAQRYGPQTSNPRRNVNPSSAITIDVHALFNAKASSYTAIFNVAQIGPSADAASSLMNDNINVVSLMPAFLILNVSFMFFPYIDKFCYDCCAFILCQKFTIC